MNPQDFQNAIPTHARDWQGNMQPIPWPKKFTILARCGSVFLVTSGPRRFSCMYGLERTDYQADATGAAQCFGTCCLHQARCEGLAD